MNEYFTNKEEARHKIIAMIRQNYGNIRAKLTEKDLEFVNHGK